MGNGGMGIRRNECERVGMGMGEWGYDGMSVRELVWEWGNEIHVNGTDAQCTITCVYVETIFFLVMFVFIQVLHVHVFSCSTL